MQSASIGKHCRFGCSDRHSLSPESSFRSLGFRVILGGWVRPSVRPSVRACCGCTSLPRCCWAWPHAVPRPRGCEQTWPSSGSHCARLPFCHHSTSASRNGTRAETCRPAAAPRRERDRQTCCSEPLTAQPGGCWLRSSQQKPAHPPPDPVWGRGALQSTGGGAYSTVAHQGRHCGWLR